MKLLKITALPLLMFLTISCTKFDALTGKQKFGVFKVLEDGVTVEMNGAISRKTEKQFDRMVKAFPNITKIIMNDCPGSKDDDTNLKVSKKMHDMGLEFHLNSTSVIASGAVDMYLSGVKRTLESGCKIGVHSWGSAPNEPAATAYPRGHEVHLKYIQYYVSVGMNQQEAEDFYYFTIEAAGADDIHWMTEEEIVQFNMSTE